MEEAKTHLRLFYQSCNGSPSPESLRRTLLVTHRNEKFADAQAAELDLLIQKSRIGNGK